MKDAKGRLATIALGLPGGGLLLAMVAAPLLMLLAAGFGAGNGFTLQNYADIFAEGLFGPLMGKSLLMGLGVTAICALLAYPVAWGIAKVVRNRGVWLALVILPFFTSQLLLIYSMMALLQAGGPVMALLSLFGVDASASILYTDAVVCIILVYEYLPYMVLSRYSAFSRIEQNQLYAARTLGAGRWRRFWSIVFPLSAPGLASGVLLVFVPATGSFVEPNLAGGADGMMVGSLIDSNFSATYNLGRGAALSVLFLLILGAATLLLHGLLRRAGRGAREAGL